MPGAAKSIERLERELQAMATASKDREERMTQQLARATEEIKDRVDERSDQLMARVRTSAQAAADAGVDLSKGGTAAKHRAGFVKNMRPGAVLKCPDGFEQRAATPKSKKYAIKPLFQKQHEILKERLYIPPSLCYGIAITVTIDVVVDIGAQLEWARCQRDVPPLDQCLALVTLLQRTVASEMNFTERCATMDDEAKQAHLPPGAITRSLFHDSSNAKQLYYCVHGHGHKAGWEAGKLKALLGKVRLLMELTEFVDPVDARGKAQQRDFEVPSDWCSRLPGDLQDIREALFSTGDRGGGGVGASGDTKSNGATVSPNLGDVQIVIVPYVYASILAFSVLNVKYFVIAVEGELDLELFSVHVPIHLYVNSRTPLWRHDVAPSPGLLIKSNPYVRTLSGRFFATVKIFGFGFTTPPVDWTGLRFFLFKLCQGFGTLRTLCPMSADQSHMDASIEPVDPATRPIKGTEVCVPCVVGKHNGRGFFSGPDFASIHCPLTPRRMVQGAGFFRDGASLIPTGTPEESNDDTRNLGNIFFQQLDANRKVWFEDFVANGHVKKRCRGGGECTAKQFLSLSPSEKGYETIRMVALCEEHVRRGTEVSSREAGFVYEGKLVVISTLTRDGAPASGPTPNANLPLGFKCIVDRPDSKFSDLPGMKQANGSPTCEFHVIGPASGMVTRREEWASLHDSLPPISDQLSIVTNGIDAVMHAMEKSWSEAFKADLDKLSYTRNLWALPVAAIKHQLVFSSRESAWVVQEVSSDSCDVARTPDRCAAMCAKSSGIGGRGGVPAASSTDFTELASATTIPFPSTARARSSDGGKTNETKGGKGKGIKGLLTMGGSVGTKFFGGIIQKKVTQMAGEWEGSRWDGLGGEGEPCRACEVPYRKCPPAQHCTNKKVDSTSGKTWGTCEPLDRYAKGWTLGYRRGGKNEHGVTAKKALNGEIRIYNEAAWAAFKKKHGKDAKVQDMKRDPNREGLYAAARLAEDEFCGSEAFCKMWCIDPTSLRHSPRCLAPIFGCDLFCGPIKEKLACEDPPMDLSPCRSGPAGQLVCDMLTNTCRKPTRDDALAMEQAGARTAGSPEAPDALKTLAHDACVSQCKADKLCTGSAGKGLQQLTTGGGKGDAGDAGEWDGTFDPVPTPPSKRRVLATGKCYECKAGMDGHFRCPAAQGRRRALQNMFANFAPAASAEAVGAGHRGALNRAIKTVLFGGADVCFDQHLGPELMDNKPRANVKRGLMVAVCNERVEAPPAGGASADSATPYHKDVTVRYTGSMVVVGAGFKSSFLGGLTSNDMDPLRLFNFAIDLVPQDWPATTADRRTIAAPVEKPIKCVRWASMTESPYRSAVSELYGHYARARNLAKAAVAPCLPNPTLDFRERVEPETQEINYAPIHVFGVSIPSAPEETAGLRSHRGIFFCKRKGVFSDHDVACGGGKEDVASRLAQLHAGGLQFNPGWDQAAMVAALDGAISYVMSVLTERGKKSRKGDFWFKMKNCDEGFWERFYSTEAMHEPSASARWGVVDEMVFSNYEISGKGGATQRPVAAEKSGVPMYGGSICALFELKIACFQYAVPQDLITETQEQVLDDGRSKAKPGSLEFYDFPPNRARVHIYTIKSKKSGGCATGAVPDTIRYFFDKRLTHEWMSDKSEFSFNKCPGSEIK